jgi:predicted lipid-binding transport protein (Tim44 family)
VNRHASSAPRLVSTLLMLGLAVVACGRQNAAPAQQPAGQNQTAAASAAASTPATAPVAVASDAQASPAATDATAGTTAPVASYSPPTTADDPVTGEIGSVDQILSGLDSSLSSSGGGE